jgi:general secretion pathway protein G
MSASTSRRAFSLLELIFVVTLIGIIATLVIQRITTHTRNARERACWQNVLAIDKASERHFLDQNVRPTDIQELNLPDYFPEGLPVCPVDGSAYQIDPTTHRVLGHDHPAAP